MSQQDKFAFCACKFYPEASLSRSNVNFLSLSDVNFCTENKKWESWVPQADLILNKYNEGLDFSGAKGCTILFLEILNYRGFANYQRHL